MAYENISLRKRNVTMIDGYFYMIDDDQDALIVKTDDGTQAYSYPLDTTIDNSVVSLEHDGRNFWTLENPAGSSIFIKKWNIENYVLQQRYDYEFAAGTGGGPFYWDCNAFTVEHYHARVHVDKAAGAPPSIDIYIPDTTSSTINLQTKLTSSMILSLRNKAGQIEDIGVSSVSIAVAGPPETVYTVALNSDPIYSYQGPELGAPTASGYDYVYGDQVSFYTKLWLFNNYNGTDGSTGCLYSSDAYTEAGGIASNPGGEYQNVQACTFYDIPNYVFNRAWQLTPGNNDSSNWPKYYSLAYVRTTNMIFLNIDDFTESYGSITMDNLESNQASAITVYDLTMEGVNVYRLQLKATYYGTTYTFTGSLYSYQLSTLEPFITNISLRANPAILPANGVNVSTITAIIKDQFDLPVVGKSVYFTEDDANGSISGGNPKNTDSNGQAVTTYTAGTTAREVKITATAQQGGVETPTD